LKEPKKQGKFQKNYKKWWNKPKLKSTTKRKVFYTSSQKWELFFVSIVPSLK
jgi:hypothetical protein